MKRSEHLYPLSWQHHDLLMAVLLVKKGVRNNTSAEVLSSFLAHVWDSILSKHIKIEEEAFCFSVSQPELSAYYQRIIEEHQQLTTMLSVLQEKKSLELVIALNGLLEQHIRYEERVFFPAVQAHISTEKMIVLGKVLGQLEKHSCLNYPVHFWE